MKFSKDFIIGFLSTFLLLLLGSAVAGIMTIHFPGVSNDEARVLWIMLVAGSVFIGWIADRGMSGIEGE